MLYVLGDGDGAIVEPEGIGWVGRVCYINKSDTIVVI